MGNTSGLQRQERSMGRGRGRGRSNQSLNPSNQIENKGAMDRSFRQALDFTNQSSPVSREKREAMDCESNSGDEAMNPINQTATVFQEMDLESGNSSQALEDSTDQTSVATFANWSRATRWRSHNRRPRKLPFNHQISSVSDKVAIRAILERESGSTRNQTLVSTYQTAAVSQERIDEMDPNKDLNSDITTTVAVSQQKRSNKPRMLLPIKKRFREDDWISSNAQSDSNQQQMTADNNLDLNQTDGSSGTGSSDRVRDPTPANQLEPPLIETEPEYRVSP